MNPPQRLGAVTALPQLRGEPFQEGPHRLGTPGLDRGDTHTVDPGSASVGGHVRPRPPHHIAAGELVVKSVEPTLPILLGAAVQHALESRNLVHAFGVADGPSRSLSTRQSSSPPSQCTGEAGALRSRRVLLSRLSSLLRPPPTPSRPPTTSRKPVIGKRAPVPRRDGAEEGLSSSHDSRPTVPRPLRRRVPRRPLQALRRLPWPSPNPHRLGTLSPPAHTGALTTLQASLHAADRPFAPPRFAAGLSTDNGGLATRDPGVSPDRTHTGWLP